MTGDGVLLQVAYDGSSFRGWARQRDVPTVEGALLSAVQTMDPSVTTLRGMSRTDAGVHAEWQMVAFDPMRTIAPRGWVLGINPKLPDSVAVRAATLVPAGFVPRFAAKRKRYRYAIYTDLVRHPLVDSRSWFVPKTLDLGAMRRAAALLEGTHDFAAFRAVADERLDTKRTLFRVTVEERSATRLDVVVEGDGFLYNMVRIIAGTLVDAGRGKAMEEAIDRALVTGERRWLGPTAPAHGLTLEWAELEFQAEPRERWP